MKNTTGGSAGQSKQVPQRQAPQNKDDLDSRENLEQDTKGDDVTHNRKEMRSDKKKVKNDNEKREL